MSIREKLRNIPTPVAASIAGLGVLIAVFVVVNYFRPSRAAGTGTKVWLKCSECGYTEQTSMDDVYRHRVDQSPEKLGPQMKCPQCGKDALRFAVKCPNPDATVFFRYYNGLDKDGNPAPGDAKCPVCGISGSDAEKAAH